MKTDNLSFGEALELLEAGHKVTRAVWSGYWIIAQLTNVTGDPAYDDKPHKMIYAYTKYGDIAPATPYQSDMLAKDWKLVN